MINGSFDNMSKSGPENVSIIDQTKFDILFNIEILNGCEHTCPGCFVNRKQEIDEEKMYKRLKELSDDVLKHGFNLREFVIGPTDFFDAFNTMDVLTNKTVQQVLKDNINARIAAPARLDLVSLDKLQKVIDVLDSNAYRKDMIIEFIMPVNNVDQVINDESYKNQIFQRLALLDNSSKQIDWSWTLNISSAVANKINETNYEALVKSVNERYDTILEMNPAISRASSKTMVKQNIKDWNAIINKVVTPENKSSTVLSMSNLYCNSINFLGITLVFDKTTNELKTFLNVNLHEQAIFHNKRFDVSGLNLLEIMEFKNKLISESLNNLNEECLYCQYSVVCANRLIHTAMDMLDINECILPKKALDLFDTQNYNEVLNDDAKAMINK